MKRGFSTVACMDATLDEILEACGKYGMEGVEIRLGEDNSILGTKEKLRIEETGQRLRKAGVTVTNLGSSLCISEYDKQAMEEAAEVIEYARLIGAKGVRIFLGHFPSEAVSGEGGEGELLAYEGIVKQLREMCGLAAGKNVEIWIETHNEFSAGRKLEKLLEQVGYDNLKVIWDIMHPIEAGEEIEETWEAIGDKIVHVHIKDGMDSGREEDREYRYTLPGEGTLPICSTLDLLSKADYGGFISFEWESLWREELKSYENSLDWVLEQYTACLSRYENNPVPKPGEAWKAVDAPGKYGASAFSIFPMGTGAVIDNRKPYASGKRYGITLQVMQGRTYRLNVPYREQDTRSRNVVYGVITLMKKSGERTRRIYLEKKKKGRLELTFRTKEETEILLELGIKREGLAMWYRPCLWEADRGSGEEKSSRKLKAAAIHLDVKELSYEENLQRIGEAFDRAASRGADLLAFPETMDTRGVKDLAYEDSFATMDGRFCSMMREKAGKYGCYVFFSFREIDCYGARRNTAVLLDREGMVVGKYHKSHLTLSEYENGMVPGDTYPVFDTEFGKVGMLVCWDFFFPEPARAMAMQGAEILLVTTAGDPIHRFIGRAKENGVYVVTSCPHTQKYAGVASTAIIDPCGNVLADTNEEGEAAMAVINLDEEKTIYWLALGPVEAMPRNVYMQEYRDDMFAELEKCACLPERA